MCLCSFVFCLPQSNTCLAFKWGASSHSYRRRRRRPSISPSSLWRSLFNLCCSGHTAVHAKMAPFLNIAPFLPPSLAYTLHDSTLSQSASHLFLCASACKCVCQFHFHLSSHTSSPHQEKLDKITPFTQKPSYYHIKKDALAVLWNSNGKIIWWRIPWYLHATPRYSKRIAKTMESFL